MSSIMTYTEKSTNDLLKKFTAPVSKVQGEPTLFKFICAIKHLMECAQEVKTDISWLNYLLLVLDPQLYTTHTSEQ